MRNYHKGYAKIFAMPGILGSLLFFLSMSISEIGIFNVEAAQKTISKVAPRKIVKAETNGFKVFDVDCDYGTLAFKGRVERTDLGDQYKYRIQIAIAFLPGEIDAKGYTMTNRTKVADLKTCELVATEFVEQGKPYKLIQREWRPISIRLTESGELGVLPDLEFFMPKTAVENATHVGLAVVGGGLAWPIPVELK